MNNLSEKSTNKELWALRMFIACVIAFCVLTGAIGALIVNQFMDAVGLTGAFARLLNVLGLLAGYTIGLYSLRERRTPEQIEEDERRYHHPELYPDAPKRFLYTRACVTFFVMLAVLIGIVYARKGCVFCAFW